MSTNTSFQMSQGLEVLRPKSGKAYPIPCEEWALLKSKINKLTSEPWFFHTIGSALLGVALSVFVTGITGVFKLPDQQRQNIILWAIFAVSAICAAVCLFFAHKERGVNRDRASDVVSQMDLIEKRYEQVSP
jgi:Na+/melibiose symporter-like transporter